MGLERGKNNANGEGRFESKKVAVDREALDGWSRRRVNREVRVNRAVEE